MSSLAMSAVTGKVLSAHTCAGYTADWALFTDWCAATNRTPLPADWSTIVAFTAGCPGAPATLRRRLAAITHHHLAAGHPPPVDPVAKEQPALPTRERIDPGQAEMVMRLPPVHLARCSDRRIVSTLGEAAGRRFEDAAPIRAIAAYRGQPSLPGWWWSAATGCHVVFESLVERHHIMEFDRAAGVVESLVSRSLWAGWRD